MEVKTYTILDVQQALIDLLMGAILHESEVQTFQPERLTSIASLLDVMLTIHNTIIRNGY